MKPGRQYELFVYEKLRRLFPDSLVTANDRIYGKESGLQREIDVSVRINCKGLELLYIFQCKDWVTKADINVLGELASVMADVGAAKGFLLCSAGFRKSNHKYAAAKGIELITIEDVKSDRWGCAILVPLIYVRKVTHYTLQAEIVAAEALVELNCRRDEIEISMDTPARVIDETPLTLKEYLERRRTDAVAGESLDVTADGLELQVVGVWVPCSHLSVVFTTQRITYLKYLTPTEYAQMRDHIRGTMLPLHVKIVDIPMRLDDTFTELPEGDPPTFSSLYLEVEESDLVAARS